MDQKLIDQFQMVRFVSLQDIESLGETFDFHGLNTLIFNTQPSSIKPGLKDLQHDSNQFVVKNKLRFSSPKIFSVSSKVCKYNLSHIHL